MKDLSIVIDAATYVRIEKKAAELKISVSDWLTLFFDNRVVPTHFYTQSGCPNPPAAK